MPKYFSDERNIPFPLHRINAYEVTVENVRAAFSKGNSVSICVVPRGLDAKSLGYIANVQMKPGEKFTLKNIVNQEEIHVDGLKGLCALLNHISGEEYSENIQKYFQHRRNNIGESFLPETIASTN